MITKDELNDLYETWLRTRTQEQYSRNRYWQVRYDRRNFPSEEAFREAAQRSLDALKQAIGEQLQALDEYVNEAAVVDEASRGRELSPGGGPLGSP